MNQHLFTNRLINQSSPYLLQHAHNPVDWFPWGDEAFDLSRQENRPILLSVGYAACHWCHVMERESFEDVEIANFLNKHYVAIKVDREQRPDIDAVYMSAVQAITGSGGWPMTVWLTPSGQPFFGGTYYPARDGDRGIGTGFLTLLQHMLAIFEQDKTKLDRHMALIQDAMQNQLMPKLKAVATTGDLNIHSTIRHFKNTFDVVDGGFGFEPKFPRPASLELLWDYGHYHHDGEAQSMVLHTLKKMACGGIYDHIGGGFHRYSVDSHWGIPHFEKMLYDNAQLTTLYLRAFARTQAVWLQRVASQTLDYLDREMSNEQNAFICSYDADSEGEEGRYFTWSKKEVSSILTDQECDLFYQTYQITDPGNFEGKNVLHMKAPWEELWPAQSGGTDQLFTLMQCQSKLYQARLARTAPAADDKVLCSWNSLAVSAFAKAALVLQKPQYLTRAQDAMTFVLKYMIKNDHLYRSYRHGTLEHLAVLEDYGATLCALTEIIQADARADWLISAQQLARQLIDYFYDSHGGGFFRMSNKQTPLLIPEKPLYDGAEPSGNALALLGLSRLYGLTGELRLKTHIDQLRASFRPWLEQQGPSSPLLLTAYLQLEQPYLQCILSSNPTHPQSQDLLSTIIQLDIPNSVLMVIHGNNHRELENVVPIARGKYAANKPTTAYICQGETCSRPLTTNEELYAVLTENNPDI